ncbi:MAG: hypothetical protein LBM27_06460, partial [Lactobacillaceae bacterium]|nr:hypothetical protein [Lactobacillaceae bacterium]
MITPKRSIFKIVRNWLIVLVVVAIYVWAFTGIGFKGLQPLSAQVGGAVVNGLFHPEWQFFSSGLDKFLNA